MSEDTNPSPRDGRETRERVDEPVDESTPLERRDYLRSVGAIGVAGILGGLGVGATGTAGAQQAWESEADQRIEENRTAPLQVDVVDSSGQPVSGAQVEVEMQEHDFNFGTAVDATELLNAGDDDPYRENIVELFNTAVLENQHKWDFWENDQSTADQATDWLNEQGLRVRGHACVWGNPDAAAIPDDVQQAIDQRDADTIIDRSMEHIEEIISHYGDDIVEWDVVNEALHEHELQIGIYDDQINHQDDENIWEGEVVPWRSEQMAEWYQQAEQVADQYGVDIAVNDFNTLSRWSYTQDWYPEEIENILDAGVDIDTIGFQTHIAARDDPNDDEFHDGDDADPDERLDWDEINEVLSIYEDYGASLAITEFDTFQGDAWSGDQEKADVLHRYMKAIYAHPNGSDFVMWGFWDGNHWGPDYNDNEPDAPLFYEDWSTKPGYDVYTDLVFDEWWTDESGTTDSSGTFTTDAFLGEHEVRVATDQDSASTTVSVTDADATATVEVTVEGGGNGNGELEYDIDGDGQTSTSDVIEFFDGFQDEYSDPGSYDFTGDGEVTTADVVELFESL